MGTLGLITAMRGHWLNPIHPIYQIESRYRPPWYGLRISRYITPVLTALGLFCLVAIVTAVLFELTQWPIIGLLSNILFQFCTVFLLAVAVLILTALMYIWPMAVAVLASRTVIQERTRRTWDPILATPLRREDLLSVKLASALRWLRGTSRVIMWLHAVLLVIVGAIAAVQIGRLADLSSPIVAIAIVPLAMFEFAIERLQDISAASLIGLTASLLSESDQVASIAAMLGSGALVISRLLLTALMIANITIPSPQAAFLLLATGPAATSVLVLNIPLLLTFLIAWPLLRELLIRLGYRWAVANLTDTLRRQG